MANLLFSTKSWYGTEQAKRKLFFVTETLWAIGHFVVTHDQLLVVHFSTRIETWLKLNERDHNYFNTGYNRMV